MLQTSTLLLLSCEFCIPVQPKHGVPVNFFAPAGAVKLWVRASTPAFEFFLYYYTLEKVVCTYLANLFGMRIFPSHPTMEEEVKDRASGRYSGRVSI